MRSFNEVLAVDFIDAILISQYTNLPRLGFNRLPTRFRRDTPGPSHVTQVLKALSRRDHVKIYKSNWSCSPKYKRNRDKGPTPESNPKPHADVAARLNPKDEHTQTTRNRNQSAKPTPVRSF